MGGASEDRVMSHVTLSSSHETKHH